MLHYLLPLLNYTSGSVNISITQKYQLINFFIESDKITINLENKKLLEYFLCRKKFSKKNLKSFMSIADTFKLYNKTLILKYKNQKVLEFGNVKGLHIKNIKIYPGIIHFGIDMLRK